MLNQVKLVSICVAVVAIVALFFTMFYMVNKLNHQEQLINNLQSHTGTSLDSLMHIVIKPGQIESVYVNRTVLVRIPPESPVTITTSDSAYQRILGEITVLETLLGSQDTAEIRRRLDAINASIQHLTQHPPVSVVYKRAGWCFKPGIGVAVTGGNRGLSISEVPAGRLKLCYASYYTGGLALTPHSAGVALGTHLDFVPALRVIKNLEAVGYVGRRYTKWGAYEVGGGLVVDF